MSNDVVDRVGFAATAVAECARLATAPVWALGDAEVSTALLDVQAAQRHLDAARIHLVGEAANRGIAARAGAVSAAAWLRGLLHLTPGAASKDVALAAAFEAEAAPTGAALAAARIGIDHAAAIARTLERVPAGVDPAVRADAQTQLLDWAAHYDPSDVERLGRYLNHVVDPDRGDVLAAAEAAAIEARELSVGTDGQGMVHGAFRLDPVAGAAFLTVLGPLAAPRPAVDGVPDQRSARRRRADALIRLVELAMASPDTPRAGGLPVSLNVTVELDTLRRRLADTGLLPGREPGELDNGVALSAETVRMLGCDARVLPIVLAGNSEPLDVGRATRTIPTALRRALITRDHGCTFPGCDRPSSWCHGHHIQHWADGGPTSLNNLALLCAAHHQAVHHDGWAVEIGPAGHPAFRPPPWIHQPHPPTNPRHRWREDLLRFRHRRC